jgi:nucleoside-diphosphate-sugar epimerase
MTTARVYRSAKKAGVKRMIILGSYFCYFNRKWPDMHLAEYHPYIHSRVEQEKIAIENSSQDMEIIVLELPYIFGSAKGRVPLWKPLVDYILSRMPLFYMKGGSNMISVEAVAKAVTGAIKWGKGGECYTIGDQNLSWTELIDKILLYGKKKKSVKIVPDWIIRIAGAVIYLILLLKRKESGLHPRIFMRIQTKEAFFDPAPAQKALHFQGGGLDDAIRNTVIACYPEKYGG